MKIQISKHLCLAPSSNVLDEQSARDLIANETGSRATAWDVVERVKTFGSATISIQKRGFHDHQLTLKQIKAA